MENKVLQENIEAVRKYDNELANNILMTEIKESNIELIKTQLNEYNLIYNGFNLHNPMGTLSEAEVIAQKAIDSEDLVKIVYGLELGYLADCFANRIKKGKIIIYEPDLSLIKFVLSVATIDALFKDNVFLCNSEETFLKYINCFTSSSSDLSVSFIAGYRNLFYDKIVELFNKAQNIYGEKIANQNTYLSKAHDVLNNTFYNLKTILNTPDISALKDVYKNKTALICCAGPSLAQNIETIKNNKDKFIIFALNQSLKLLNQNSITPDFIVDIEAIDNRVQFEGVDTKNSYLIAETCVRNEILNKPYKNKFFYISQNNFVNPVILNLLNLKTDLKTFGTVSYSAVQSAVLMGFNRIILIGQDLAYKDGKCYASGSQYEDLECLFNEKTQKYEITVKDFEKYRKNFEINYPDINTATYYAKWYLNELNQNIRTIKAQNGELIPTSAGYQVFIRIFKQLGAEIKAQNPEIELINSSNGAQIDEFKNIALDEITKELNVVERIDLSNIKQTALNEEVYLKIKDITKKLNNFIDNFKQFNELNKKLLKELQNKKVITLNIQKMLQKHITLYSLIINIANDKNLHLILSYYLISLDKNIAKDYLSDVDNLVKALKYMTDTFDKFNKIYIIIFDYLSNF